MSTRKLAERRSLLPAVTMSEGEEEEPPKDYGPLCLSLSEGMITTTLAGEGEDDTTSQEEKGTSTQKGSDDDKPRPSVSALAIGR